MPVRTSARARARRYCQRRPTWSNTRGGCRFDPGHAGACKPGRRP